MIIFLVLNFFYGWRMPVYLELNYSYKCIEMTYSSKICFDRIIVLGKSYSDLSIMPANLKLFSGRMSIMMICPVCVSFQLPDSVGLQAGMLLCSFDLMVSYSRIQIDFIYLDLLSITFHLKSYSHWMWKSRPVLKRMVRYACMNTQSWKIPIFCIPSVISMYKELHLKV